MLFSLRFALLTTIAQVAIGIFLAVYLAPLLSKRPWLMAILMLPMMAAPSLVGLMYRLILHEFVGVLPYYFYLFFNDSPSFLGPRNAFWTLVAVETLRQYSGQLTTRQSQVAVSLSIANHHASLPVAYQLYLPKDWAKDRARRRKAGVPKQISFKTKPRIALEQLRWACEAGLPRGVVLMDAGYGADTDLRANITTLGLSYVAGIMPNTTVWATGTGPLPPKKWSGRGRPPKLIGHEARHRPISVKALARGLPKGAWRTIEWREGAAERLSSRFARVRVRVAHRDYQLTDNRPEEWLLIEWPEGEKEPTNTRYQRFRRHRLPLAGRPHQAALAHRTRLSGAQAGGRARAFRRAGMARLPPPRHAVHRGLRIADLREGDNSPLSTSSRRVVPAICATQGYQPRGSAPASRTAHPKLDRNRTPATDRRSRQHTAEVSVLHSSNRQTHAPYFMMQ